MSHAAHRAPGAAFERVTRRLVAAAEDSRVAAAEGLLGLAERADAAERAAAERTGPATAVPDELDLALRRLLEQRDPEPAAPASSPVRPSTTRPEFTALLHQLQATTSSTTPPAPPSTPPPAPTLAPAPAAVPAAYREAAEAVAPISPSPAAPAAPAIPTVPAVPAVPAVPPQGGAPAIERHTLGHPRADRVGAPQPGPA